MAVRPTLPGGPGERGRMIPLLMLTTALVLAAVFLLARALRAGREARAHALHRNLPPGPDVPPLSDFLRWTGQDWGEELSDADQAGLADMISVLSRTEEDEVFWTVSRWFEELRPEGTLAQVLASASAWHASWAYEEEWQWESERSLWAQAPREHALARILRRARTAA